MTQEQAQILIELLTGIKYLLILMVLIIQTFFMLTLKFKSKREYYTYISVLMISVLLASGILWIIDN